MVFNFFYSSGIHLGFSPSYLFPHEICMIWGQVYPFVRYKWATKWLHIFRSWENNILFFTFGQENIYARQLLICESISMLEIVENNKILRNQIKINPLLASCWHFSLLVTLLRSAAQAVKIFIKVLVARKETRNSP